MRRLLKVLGGIVIIFAVFFVVVAALGGARTNAPGSGGSDPAAGDAPGLALKSAAFGRREGDHAAFLVTFANTTDAPIDNPQLRVAIDLGGQTFSCPGWFDTVTDESVTGMDPVTRPLVIPAQSETWATILCRIPDVPMDEAVVHLR